MSENYKEGNQTEYNKKTVYVSSGLKKNRKKKRLAGRGRNFAETGAVEEAAADEPLDFKTIKLSYNVNAKFVLE